jgi:hypothetical protein
MTWLPPIPNLIRRDPDHRYFLNDTPFPVSITGVLRIEKSDFAMARIQATQHIWQPRGTETHRAMELHILSRVAPQLDSEQESCSDLADLVSELDTLRHGEHSSWIEPLIAHPRWHLITPIASERATCCITRRIAGTYDLAYTDPKLPPSPDRPSSITGPAIVLADLKTLGTIETNTYCTRPQLGGYMALEATHGHWYDYGQTIWARPGATTFSPLYSRRECLLKWAAVWTRYQQLHHSGSLA